MALQPCGCGMTEDDWPYDPSDFDSVDDNGLKCGDDGDGNTIAWVHPTGDVGSFVATKGTANAIASGGWTNLGNCNERAGGSYFNGVNKFTAPRAGMYAVTFNINPATLDTYNFYARVVSDYAAWGNPYLKQHDSVVPFLGGGIAIGGDLPCIEGGTLTYQVYHSRSPTASFEDILMSAIWRCPLP